MVAATAIVVAVVVVVVTATLLRRRSNRRLPPQSGEKVYKLNPFELAFHIQTIPSISTITFLTSKNIDAAAQALEERLAKTVAANPWLSGRLAHRDGQPSLVVLEAHAPPIRLWRGQLLGISPRSPYASIEKAALAAGLLVTRGVRALNHNEPLLKASLAETDTVGEYVLIVSLSHAICDGADFYAIHNMLASGAPFVRLDPLRDEAVTARARRLFGDAEFDLLTPMPPSYIAYLFASKLRCVLFGPPTEQRFHFVSDEWLAARKAEAVAEGAVPFVSLTDAVTSTFFHATGADLGTLVVNCRGRLAGCDPTSAGNHESLLHFMPADFASPSLIRSALCGGADQADPTTRRPMRRAAVPATELMSRGGLVGGHLAGVTSWCSFTAGLSALPVILPETTHELHLPLMALDFPPNAVSACIIFLAKPGRRAVRLFGTAEKLDKVAASGMLGEPLGLRH